MRKGICRGHAAGFTLIEMLVIILVISILAAVAMSGQGDTVRKSKEKAAQADLNALRKAVGLYGSDTSGGAGPAALADLTTSGPNGQYIAKIPQANIPPYHPASDSVLASAVADDAGGWGYSPGAATPVYVNCTHTDTKGTVWTAY